MSPPTTPSVTASREDLLAENAHLRREIDHRVRNSLQVVASLIDVTSRSSTEPAARSVLAMLRARVSGMIAVYRTLDDVPHRAMVDMGETLQDLALQVVETISDRPVRPAVKVSAEGVVLPLDDAMPVALMVIEVLLAAAIDTGMNSPTALVALTRDLDQATLRVDLAGRSEAPGQLVMGEPALHMIQALARQLGGPLRIEQGIGQTLALEVTFPVRALTGLTKSPPLP
ncbi:MAG: hypothetical protein CFE28_14650 [Alphaproteobacteria bacterium PA2]|nr:MAG: hypothetical protein CFE28_14650 [Alphaproteobacteria bacterium PA2]